MSREQSGRRLVFLAVYAAVLCMPSKLAAQRVSERASLNDVFGAGIDAEEVLFFKRSMHLELPDCLDNTRSGWRDNPYYQGTVPALRLPSGPSKEKLEEIEAMGYHGIGLWMTHAEFLRVFPHAKPAWPADAMGVISYAIDDNDGKRDAIWFQFFDDRFLRIAFAYGEKRLKECGGPDALLERAKKRFGPPKREDDRSATWLFPSIDRIIAAENDRGTWYLTITSLSVQKALNTKEAQAKFGF